MTHAAETLTPVDPNDLAAAPALARGGFLVLSGPISGGSAIALNSER